MFHRTHRGWLIIERKLVDTISNVPSHNRFTHDKAWAIQQPVAEIKHFIAKLKLLFSSGHSVYTCQLQANSPCTLFCKFIFWPFHGFIETTELRDDRRWDEKERGDDMQQGATCNERPRVILEPRNTAVRTGPLYMWRGLYQLSHCSAPQLMYLFYLPRFLESVTSKMLFPSGNLIMNNRNESTGNRNDIHYY